MNNLPAIYLNRWSKYVIIGRVKYNQANELVFEPNIQFEFLNKIQIVLCIFNLLLIARLFIMQYTFFTFMKADDYWLMFIPISCIIQLVLLFAKKQRYEKHVPDLEAIETSSTVRQARMQDGEFLLIFSDKSEYDWIIKDIFPKRELRSFIDSYYIELAFSTATSVFLYNSIKNLKYLEYYEKFDVFRDTFKYFIIFVGVLLVFEVVLNTFRFNKTYLPIRNYFFPQDPRVSNQTKKV